jgi:iron-sulfur cluster repair protein YtfE (RIC family)
MKEKHSINGSISFIPPPSALIPSLLASQLPKSLGRATARINNVRYCYSGSNRLREDGRNMNAFELLKQDHKKVSGIFEKLEPTTERGVKTREELFAQLKQELDIHARIEETIFYPVIKEAKETKDITLEAYEEHNVVKQLLAELDELSKDDETWGAKLKVLKENVEHHVEEEEEEMFPSARKVLSPEQIEELGTRMEASKKEQRKASAAG